MSELIPNYPANDYSEIIDYVSVAIFATGKGKPMDAEGKGDELTAEQKTILKTADIGSRIKIKIKEMEYEVKASTIVSSGIQACDC